MARVLLALDLSTQVGWAVGPIGGRATMFGTWVLPQIGGEGARFASFENVLADCIAVHDPAVMAVEAPLPLPAINNREVAFQQLGLRAMALSEAYRASASVHESDAYSVRREVLGTGRFAKGHVKRAVTEWAKREGYDAPDHNAADALVLWTYYARRLGR